MLLRQPAAYGAYMVDVSRETFSDLKVVVTGPGEPSVENIGVGAIPPGTEQFDCFAGSYPRWDVRTSPEATDLTALDFLTLQSEFRATLEAQGNEKSSSFTSFSTFLDGLDLRAENVVAHCGDRPPRRPQRLSACLHRSLPRDHAARPTATLLRRRGPGALLRPFQTCKSVFRVGVQRDAKEPRLATDNARYKASGRRCVKAFAGPVAMSLL